MNFEIHPIRAFTDNYIWVIVNRHQGKCVVVDPGESDSVQRFMQEHDLRLEAVLITHHHWDHTGGIAALCARNKGVSCYGPGTIKGVSHPLSDGDSVTVLKDTPFKVIAVPGHTMDHIAYYSDESLFCGDTLFSCGCGRLFEGCPQDMLNSLKKLASLPKETSVYCAHEYTLTNIRFALTAEPNNNNLIKYKSHIEDVINQGHPSLPSTIEKEMQLNPFLRCTQKTIIENVQKRYSLENIDELSIFAHLRQWKDDFC